MYNQESKQCRCEHDSKPFFSQSGTRTSSNRHGIKGLLHRNPIAEPQIPQQSSTEQASPRLTAMHSATSGRSQNRPENPPHIRLHNHAELLPGSALNLLRSTSSHHGHKAGLSKSPTGFPPHLPRSLHHHPSAGLRPVHSPLLSKSNQVRNGDISLATNRNRTSPFHHRNGNRSSRRNQAKASGLPIRTARLHPTITHHILLDCAPVLVSRLRRPFHARWPFGVFLHRSAAEHEVSGHIAHLGLLGHGLLSQLRHCLCSERCFRQVFRTQMARRKQVKPLSSRALLLAHVCSQRGQLLALPFLGLPVQIQNNDGKYVT